MHTARDILTRWDVNTPEFWEIFESIESPACDCPNHEQYTGPVLEMTPKQFMNHTTRCDTLVWREARMWDTALALELMVDINEAKTSPIEEVLGDKYRFHLDFLLFGVKDPRGFHVSGPEELLKVLKVRSDEMGPVFKKRYGLDIKDPEMRTFSYIVVVNESLAEGEELRLWASMFDVIHTEPNWHILRVPTRITIGSAYGEWIKILTDEPAEAGDDAEVLSTLALLCEETPRRRFSLSGALSTARALKG